VKNAFFHAELREEVYMYPPSGYLVLDGHACWLCRSLYGLKQAPRAWFERFTSVAIAAGFVASQLDPALFVHTSSRGRTLILLYVDDMLITDDDLDYIAFIKARLSAQFHMSDLGPLSFFLGMRSPPHLMAINLSSTNTFKISLIVLVLLITVLWTLSWIFTFVFVPQMVFLLRIPLAIAILLAVLPTLA
jgi:hypothetical protein